MHPFRSIGLAAGSFIIGMPATKTLATLRKGLSFKVKVSPDDGGANMQWSISLKGFGAAFDRVAALLK